MKGELRIFRYFILLVVFISVHADCAFKRGLKSESTPGEVFFQSFQSCLHVTCEVFKPVPNY